MRFGMRFSGFHYQQLSVQFRKTADSISDAFPRIIRIWIPGYHVISRCDLRLRNLSQGSLVCILIEYTFNSELLKSDNEIYILIKRKTPLLDSNQGRVVHCWRDQCRIAALIHFYFQGSFSEEFLLFVICINDY